jgi:hypothetical protein
MKCDKCSIDLPEREIEESHDVPCYLFEGEFRNIRKNQADKFGRHWLCKKCHKQYEEALKFQFQLKAVEFAKEYFKD